MTKEQITQSRFLELINGEIKNNPINIEGLVVKEIGPDLKYSYIVNKNPAVNSEAQEKIINDAITAVSSPYEFQK